MKRDLKYGISSIGNFRLDVIPSFEDDGRHKMADVTSGLASSL
jgi:hypothetical protein